MYQDLVIMAVFILIYSSIAGAIERTWISGAIIFTAFGLLIGPVGLDLISFKADREAIRTLAELKGADACDVMLPRLSDPAPAVRASAVTCLVSYGDEEMADQAEAASLGATGTPASSR